MECPHCKKAIHVRESFHDVISDDIYNIGTTSYICPACGNAVVRIRLRKLTGHSITFTNGYPRSALRPAPSTEVPPDLAQDYIEASLVLSDSPKASAALSRRCLQHLIRQYAGIKEHDLATEIQKLIDTGGLPSHLIDAVDGIRHIGNFAAHPIKGTTSGEIIDVEAGEAEWTLEVLDGLFDFFFVQPALLKSKREALDAKLAAAGKPAMK